MIKQTNPATAEKGYTANTIDISYYTDPLCCWSWAFEEEWRKLLQQYKNNIRYRYVMGGLLPAWNSFHDPLHAVSRPAQLGPVWMHAQQTTGVPINYNIWAKDPPASSYPSCIAVKCAGLQSFHAAEQYLRMAREAVMKDGLNIAKRDVLIQVAWQIATNGPGLLNVDQFIKDFDEGKGYEPFRQDLHETQIQHISRFPALIIRQHAKRTVMVTGYRTSAALIEIINGAAAQNSAAATHTREQPLA